MKKQENHMTSFDWSAVREAEEETNRKLCGHFGREVWFWAAWMKGTSVKRLVLVATETMVCTSGLGFSPLKSSAQPRLPITRVDATASGGRWLVQGLPWPWLCSAAGWPLWDRRKDSHTAKHWNTRQSVIVSAAPRTFAELNVVSFKQRRVAAGKSDEWLQSNIFFDIVSRAEWLKVPQMGRF